MPEGDLTDADLEITHLFTEEGLRELVRLGWSYYTLKDTKITDKGLKEVAKLQNLESLHFNGTPITDAGLKEVAAESQMACLSRREGGQVAEAGTSWLDRTKITDAGLMEVAKLQQLTVLNLGSKKL